MKNKNFINRLVRGFVLVMFLFGLNFNYFIPSFALAQNKAPAKPANGAPATTPTTSPGPTPGVAGGAESTIKSLLCAPTENLSGYGNQVASGGDTTNQVSAGGDLFYCINKLYRFAIAIAAVAAVMFLVIAGYLYASGGEEAVSEAKAIMGSTVAGLFILLISYIFLRTINPDLIQFKPIQLPQIVGGDLSLCNPLKQDCVYRPDGSIAGSAGAAGSTGKGGQAAQAAPGNSANLAQQIAKNGNIQLAPNNVSGKDPQSSPKQNITDTAAGNKAKTSTYGDAGGEPVQLSDAMLSGMLAVGGKLKIYITEIAGGDHSESSRHYRGYAFDVGQVNGKGISAANAQPVKDACRAAGASEILGPGDAGHDTHVHCAW